MLFLRKYFYKVYLKILVTTDFLINIIQNTKHDILLPYLYNLYSILPLHHFQEGDGDGASFDEDDVSTKY